jgi:hypothetical protein
MAFKMKKPTLYGSGLKKLKTGTPSTVGGDLGGSSYKTETPLNQVPLQPGEDENIKPATEKDNKQEIIFDIEDRIGFINEDINNQGGEANEDQAAALRILEDELKRLRPEKEDRPDPTYEGTDEFRPEEEIPEVEKAKRN